MTLYKNTEIDPNGIWDLQLDADRVNKYFAASAVNNSLLSMAYNPIWLKWKIENKEVEDTEKRHFRIGSAVDCLLTDPQRWEEEFYIFSESRPGGLMGKFIDALPVDQLWDFMSDDEINQAYTEAYIKSGYKKKKEAVIKAFEEGFEYRAYFRARQLSLGKKILSTDEMAEIENAIQSINRVPLIKEWFYPLNKDTPERRVYHQVDIYFEYQGCYCKALLDGLIIDHTTKSIIPFDLKTTAKAVYDFEDVYWMFGYYRQFAFYYKACEIAFKDMIEDGYTIRGGTTEYLKDIAFSAIVAPKKDDGYPAIIFDISHSSIDIGLTGGTVEINGVNKNIKGIDELLECYKWHNINNYYDTPRWVYDSGYRMLINKKKKINL